MNSNVTIPNISRLQVPFSDIFTTVYTVKTEQGAVLFDTATYDSDVDTWILPFLQAEGITEEQLKYVVISHDHGDHAGGLKRFMELYPNVCIISRSSKLKEQFAAYHFCAPEDNDSLLDVLRIVTIPGHAADCIALLDTRTNTLISGDCLQLHGIFGSGEWGSNIRLPIEYQEAIRKLRTMPLSTICAAHDYHPCGWLAQGAEEITRFLDECIPPLDRLRRIIQENPALDDLAIQALFNGTGEIPRIRVGVVSSMRASMG